MDHKFKFYCVNLLKDGEQGNMGSEQCRDADEFVLLDGLKLNTSANCADNEYVKGMKSNTKQPTHRRYSNLFHHVKVQILAMAY